MGAVDVWRPAPRTLEDVRDPHGQDAYPRQVLSDSSTALVLFSARWHGRQDAYWICEKGLAGTCVDLDGPRLGEMQHVYPAGWEFVEADAFTFCESAFAIGRTWDIVSLDPWSNQFQECADQLLLWCSVATDAVILGTGTDTEVVPPSGWQVVNVHHRSDFGGGVYWTVLEPTGHGITPDKVSACLVTRGDQPEQMARIIGTLPYDEIIVWDNSVRLDFKTAARYMAAFEAKHEVVYFQDDDTLFRHHDELMAAYEPGRITAVYGHGDTPGGYHDLPLVCGGALADRDVLREAMRHAESDPEALAYMDFHVGILAPFKHVHLPFEINMRIAQHPSRLCNQSWAAAAKQRVTERARTIRDGR